MGFAQTLTYLMEKRGITAYKMGKDTKISDRLIGYWKSGEKLPNAENLIIIAKYFSTSIDYLLTGSENINYNNIELTVDEEKLLSLYNQLPYDSKSRILERAETLAELAAERAAKERAAEQPKKPAKVAEPAADELTDDEPDESEQDEEFYIDLCSLPASAGTGVQLDEGYTEPMQIKHTYIAERANYAVRVSGDSMETEYSDGDIVLVETCPDVAVGEIGIFIVNDQGYIKQRGEDRLISLNPEYDDVFIQEGDVVSCRGRVLGKAELVK